MERSNVLKGPGQMQILFICHIAMQYENKEAYSNSPLSMHGLRKEVKKSEWRKQEIRLKLFLLVDR